MGRYHYGVAERSQKSQLEGPLIKGAKWVRNMFYFLICMGRKEREKETLPMGGSLDNGAKREQKREH